MCIGLLSGGFDLRNTLRDVLARRRAWVQAKNCIIGVPAKISTFLIQIIKFSSCTWRIIVFSFMFYEHGQYVYPRFNGISWALHRVALDTWMVCTAFRNVVRIIWRLLQIIWELNSRSGLSDGKLCNITYTWYFHKKIVVTLLFSVQTFKERSDIACSHRGLGFCLLTVEN